MNKKIYGDSCCGLVFVSLTDVDSLDWGCEAPTVCAWVGRDVYFIMDCSFNFKNIQGLIKYINITAIFLIIVCTKTSVLTVRSSEYNDKMSWYSVVIDDDLFP
jgi:hypothetical protein